MRNNFLFSTKLFETFVRSKRNTIIAPSIVYDVVALRLRLFKEIFRLNNRNRLNDL